MLLGWPTALSKKFRVNGKNLTFTAKKEFSDFGKEHRKTGGGPAPKKPSNATAKIKKLRMEILPIGKELDDADKENLPN